MTRPRPPAPVTDAGKAPEAAARLPGTPPARPPAEARSPDPQGGRGASSAPAALRRTLLNAAALLGAYVLPRLFTFGAVVVAARVLGPGDFGAYGTAAAYAVILSILATLGMTPLLVREIARAPGRAGELLGAAHRVKAVTGVVMLLALVALAHLVLGYPAPVVAAALLLGVGYGVGAFVENVGAYFQAIERMHVWMQASAVFGLVTGAAGIALVWTTGSVVWFCAAPVVGQLAALAWLLARLPRRLRRPEGLGSDDAIRLARALVPFAAAFVALTVFYKVDVLLLTAWRTAEEVGIYVAAYKFVDVAHALVLAVVAAAYPRLCREAPATEVGERWAATRVTELLVLAALPGAAVLWFLRGDLVEFLFGGGYGPSAEVVALLAPALPALALNLLAGYVLAARSRMGLVAAGYLGAGSAKVVLNAVLVPTYGAEGAAAAMLASELLLALCFAWALRHTAGAAPGGRTLAVAAGTAGLWAGAWLIGSSALLFLLGVAVLYALGGALPAREWRILRAALAPGGEARPP